MSLLDKNSFELLSDCIKSASGIASTLNKIKKKRKAMSDTQITDEVFNEFLLSILNPQNVSLIQELKHKWREYLMQPVVKAPIPSVPEREPLFTTVDNIPIYEGDAYYSVSDSFEVYGTYNAHRPIDAATKRAFSIKEKANEYVMLNRPFLSIQDVMTRLNGYFAKESTIPAFENLKVFYQSKSKP